MTFAVEICCFERATTFHFPFYTLHSYRFRVTKRLLLKRRNKEFHDPDAAIVTLLLRWPVDNALDRLDLRFSARLHVHVLHISQLYRFCSGVLCSVH